MTEKQVANTPEPRSAPPDISSVTSVDGIKQRERSAKPRRQLPSRRVGMDFSKYDGLERRFVIRRHGENRRKG